MSNQFTPGPWGVAHTTVYALHGDPPRNRFTALVQSGRADDAQGLELVANARLIAAAPDLVAALREADIALEAAPDSMTTRLARQKVRAAISKATGES